MSWKLIRHPRLLESFPEWLNYIAKENFYTTISRFTKDLGFGHCTYESLYYDPSSELMEYVSKKTGIPLKEIEGRTAKWLDHFWTDTISDIENAKKMKAVGVITERDARLNDRRLSMLDNCNALTGYNDIKTEAEFVRYILDDLSERFSGWMVVVPERAQLDILSKYLLSFADQILSQGMILKIVDQDIVYSKAMITNFASVVMRRNVESLTRRRSKCNDIDDQLSMF